MINKKVQKVKFFSCNKEKVCYKTHLLNNAGIAQG